MPKWPDNNKGEIEFPLFYIFIRNNKINYAIKQCNDVVSIQ